MSPVTSHHGPRLKGPSIRLAETTFLCRAISLDARFLGLSATAKAALYTAVLRHMNGDGQWWISRKTWRDEYGATKSSHDRAAKELRDSGLVSAELHYRPPTHGGMTQTSNTYTLDAKLVAGAKAEFLSYFGEQPETGQLPADGDVDRGTRVWGGGGGTHLTSESQSEPGVRQIDRIPTDGEPRTGFKRATNGFACEPAAGLSPGQVKASDKDESAKPTAADVRRVRELMAEVFREMPA